MTVGLWACRETANPSPTLPPNTAEPLVVATATETSPAPTPTSVISAAISTERFTHSTHRFSIAYPANWQLFEQPTGVIFIQPENQVGYSVFFNDVGQNYSTEELNQYLVTFVARNFVKEGADFQAISQNSLPDGSVVAQFAARDPYLGPAINEIRVKQVETVIFIFLVSANEAQWSVSEAALQKLADTFTPLDTSPLETTPEPSEAPVWELTGPTSNTFGFIVPSDWETLYRDDSTVAVGLPNEAIRFEATILPWNGTNPAPAAAEEEALAYLADNAAQYKNLENLAPTEFPLDTTTGATIDFLFTAEDQTPMAGSVITAAHEGKLYRVVFTAPARLYEGALQWFNPMIQSFRFLNPKEFIDEEEKNGG